MLFKLKLEGKMEKKTLTKKGLNVADFDKVNLDFSHYEAENDQMNTQSVRKNKT